MLVYSLLPMLQSAIRGHDNPALDVARSQASSWGVPLVVATFMMLSHPFANARRFKVRERGGEQGRVLCFAVILACIF